MSDEEETTVTSVYVLPTEAGQPPRALLMEGDQQQRIDETGVAGPGTLAVWSADTGSWCVAGNPLAQEFSEVITNHAKSLGVEW